MSQVVEAERPREAGPVEQRPIRSALEVADLDVAADGVAEDEVPIRPAVAGLLAQERLPLAVPLQGGDGLRVQRQAAAALVRLGLVLDEAVAFDVTDVPPDLEGARVEVDVLPLERIWGPGGDPTQVGNAGPTPSIEASRAALPPGEIVPLPPMPEATVAAFGFDPDDLPAEARRATAPAR